MKPPNLTARLAQRLAAGEPLLGTLLRMPNETLIEMTALVGMDFVVIDTEHGPSDQIPLTAHLTAAAAAGIPAIVRVGNNSEILRVLDLGAAGIIAPHISTVEQAEAVVRAAHYPPRGDRGFATYTRSGAHGLTGPTDHLANAADVTVILMIEDTPGVQAAQQIAAVDGVTALFVGPADLSTAMGLPGQQNSSPVQRAIADVHAAARRSGAAVVTITGEPAAARQHFESGSNMVIYNVLSALGGLFTSLAAAHPDAVAARPESGPTEPVVFLPGMLGGPRSWDAVLAEMPDTVPARVGRIDLDDSIAGMAESVLAQAPPRFSLVGHSLGGVVALEVARRAPDRVRKLVLVNASGRGPTEDQRLMWKALDQRTADGGFTDLLDEQAQLNLGPVTARPEVLAAFVQGAREVGPDGYRRQLAAQSLRPDFRPELAGIAAPTLVVSGELDQVCPPDRQAELVAGIAGAIRIELPGVGHCSPLQAPVELAAAIGDFLSG